MLLSDHRLLFFGGKGGVGKTTLASAAALSLARRGRRVLVASTDPAHNLGHLWETTVGSGRVRLAADLWGTELDPAEVAREHVASVSATVQRLLPEHLHRRVRQYFDLTLESPGTHEAALTDAIARLITDGLAEFDTIVFDTAPTGHTTRLLDMPALMGMWTDGLLANRDRADRFSDAIRGLDGGRRAPDAVDVRNSRIRELLDERRDRFARVQERLTDHALTGFVVVTVPERLPVVESLDLYAHLRRSDMAVPMVLVNRCAGPDAESWVRDAQRAAIDELRAGVRAPLVELPAHRGPLTGPTAVAAVADSLQAAVSAGGST